MHPVFRKYVYSILLAVFSSNLLFAQHIPVETLNSSQTFHYGFIMAHRDNMGQLIKGHIKIAEYCITTPTLGNKVWHQVHNFPDLGLSFIFVDLANRKQLGNTFAIIPHASFKLTNREKFNLEFRVGTGLAYFHTTFDVYDNYKNNVISSHLNAAVNFLFQTNWNLTERISLKNGFALTHFSNGSFKYPNLGINLATINTGITYKFGKITTPVKIDTLSAFEKNNVISVLGNIGAKETIPAGGTKYFASSLIINAERSINRKSKYGMGLDLFYDTSLKRKFEFENGKKAKGSDLYLLGLNVGYAYSLNKLDLLINTGAYLYYHYKGNGPIYSRIGLRYFFENNMIVNLSLKTHFAKADQLEFGIGYRIR